MKNIQLVSAKFSKPSHGQFPYHVDYEFVCVTDTELPHGYKGTGGQLLKVDGGWQARHWDRTPWGPVGPTREAAVFNVLPATLAAMTDYKKQRDEEEAANLRKHKEDVAAAKKSKVLSDAAPGLLKSLIAILPAAEELLSDMMQDPTPLRGSGWQALADEIANAKAAIISAEVEA